ncbi:MAG: pyridoxamine 5'-phosphate oxidase family protein [Eubacteriales bacterium]|nr:pyridoxamine 5'-phosphate oxidase family protein [Eubacteriales bacterium]MDY4008955.1 pyridoxamine 5'-phosphate oxidase family protein [Candidatus Limiplasma sp.]
MKPIRRTDRAVTSREGLRRILDACKVCRIAVRDAEGLYIVPMNYGYLWTEEQPRLYFHCAHTGRKLEAIARDPHVAFEVDGEHQLIEAASACGYGYAFESITGSAIASVVEDVQEKCEALSLLMRHQTGRFFSFTPDMASTVTVLRLDVAHMAGKRRERPEEASNGKMKPDRKE